MATIETQTNRLSMPPIEPAREEKSFTEVVAGGSMAEAIGGIATVILAIIALAGVYPAYLAAIAAIVVGAALLLQGGTMTARFSRLLTETAGTHFMNRELGGGMSAEFLGGAAGIVLGILSLLNIYSGVLLPVSVIVFGGVLLLACGTRTRLNSLTMERCVAGNEVARRVAGEMVSASNGAQALVGLAAIILGIIGLVEIYPLTLTLVAFLCLGASVLLSSAAISSKMFSMMRG